MANIATSKTMKYDPKLTFQLPDSLFSLHIPGNMLCRCYTLHHEPNACTWTKCLHDCNLQAATSFI